MLDLKLVTDDPAAVRRAIEQKRTPDALPHLDALAALAERRRAAIAEGDEIRAKRNTLSKAVGERKRTGADAADLVAESTRLGARVGALEAETKAVEAEIDAALTRLPNVPDPDVPVGADAEANRVVATHGTKPAPAFAPKPHWELAERLGIHDLARGTKVAGSGFPLYVGMGAALERALLTWMLDVQVREHGYTEILPPFLANAAAMLGSAQLPRHADQMYRCADDALYLIPTAEVPLTNLHAGEILPRETLPRRYTAMSACFRREAGAAGRDTRGIQRVHQFNKVELMCVSPPEDSPAELERIRGHAEAILQRLGLHYRVLLLCTGDMSFASAKTYDLEVWAPGLGKYLEVSSVSNFREYQARRADLRFRDEKKRVRYTHTLNGSGVATPRLTIALLETWQQADGSVVIPEPLRPYLHGCERLVPPA